MLRTYLVGMGLALVLVLPWAWLLSYLEAGVPAAMLGGFVLGGLGMVLSFWITRTRWWQRLFN